ncbi:MAG: hypothetical protein CL941_00625, partial [Desulfobacter sp.]|nr:hypothetical protein [Desulfobacter sp.]
AQAVTEGPGKLDGTIPETGGFHGHEPVDWFEIFDVIWFASFNDSCHYDSPFPAIVVNGGGLYRERRKRLEKE